MHNIQNHFLDFHDAIKMGTYDENETLRSKRTTVVKALKTGLKKIYEDKDEDPPEFCDFAQGSYALSTGVKPIETTAGLDYDIDVGIVFKGDTSIFTEPVALKELVHKSLSGHTEVVSIRHSCVTVVYKAGYHVDLAIYVHPEMDINGELPLAKGRPGSLITNKYWEQNEPLTLGKEIQRVFTDANARAQFRRVIRYLKRWRDLKYKGELGDAAPVGVGLTIAGLSLFCASIDTVSKEEDDLQAVLGFVSSLVSAFADNQWSAKDGAYGRRIVVMVPFAPATDVFWKITNVNMEKLEKRLKALKEKLEAAVDKSDCFEAAEVLQKAFGDDFPICVKKSDTKGSAQRWPQVIVPSNQSG